MKEENQQLLQRGLIIGVLVVVCTAILVFAFRGDGGSTQVVLHNVGECPEVMMILRRADGADTITIVAKSGTTERADIKPGITYIYEVRFPAEPDAQDRLCKADGINETTDDGSQIIFDRGEVAVPAGKNFDYNVASDRGDSDDEDTQ